MIVWSGATFILRWSCLRTFAKIYQHISHYPWKEALGPDEGKKQVWEWLLACSPNTGFQKMVNNVVVSLMLDDDMVGCDSKIGHEWCQYQQWQKGFLWKIDFKMGKHALTYPESSILEQTKLKKWGWFFHVCLLLEYQFHLYSSVAHWHVKDWAEHHY